MSTQRQNSLSNISPPQFPSCPQLFALPPTLRKEKKKKRKDNLFSKGKLVSGTDFILSNIPLCSYMFATVNIFFFFTKYYVSSLISLQIVSSSLGAFWKLLRWIKLSGRQLLLKNAPFSKLTTMFPCCQRVNSKWNSKPFQLQYILIYKSH